MNLIDRLTFRQYEATEGHPTPRHVTEPPLEFFLDRGGWNLLPATVRRAGFDPAGDHQVGSLMWPWAGHPAGAVVVYQDATFVGRGRFAVSAERGVER